MWEQIQSIYTMKEIYLTLHYSIQMCKVHLLDRRHRPNQHSSTSVLLGPNRPNRYHFVTKKVQTDSTFPNASPWENSTGTSFRSTTPGLRGGAECRDVLW